METESAATCPLWRLLGDARLRGYRSSFAVTGIGSSTVMTFSWLVDRIQPLHSRRIVPSTHTSDPTAGGGVPLRGSTWMSARNDWPGAWRLPTRILRYLE